MPSELFAGLDVGSRTIALVVIHDGAISQAQVVDTGPVPEDRARALLGDEIYDRVVVTGYGRHLPLDGLRPEPVSEIRL